MRPGGMSEPPLKNVASCLEPGNNTQGVQHHDTMVLPQVPTKAQGFRPSH